ncbi:MAG: hypothetical protein EOO13_18335 [Chitinophagaceae bacterium]|nr:MAG: hypothetical protein EOO13_18335 [Chitinophagaceae bacterium]
MKSQPNITDLGMMVSIKDLSNPLTNIMLCLDLLDNGNITEQTKAAYLLIIKKNANAMRESLQEMYTALAEKYKGTQWEEHAPSFKTAEMPGTSQNT